MAKEYPAALFYDFKITFPESRQLGNSKVDLSRLSSLLLNPTMEKFVDALRLLHHPELRWKEGLREVAKILEENKTSDAKAKAVKLWEDCFALERPLLQGKIGRYNREWAKKTKKEMEKILGRNCSNVTLKTISSARNYITNHFSVTPGKFGIRKDMKAHLGDFGEWLEEFDPSKAPLELPGQYSTCEYFLNSNEGDYGSN